MWRELTSAAFLLVLTLWCPRSAIGIPINIPAPPNTRVLYDGATFVCAGDITEIEDIGPQPASTATDQTGTSYKAAVLSIDRCYKSQVPTRQIRVRFARKSSALMLFYLRSGDYALFFLNPASDGDFVLYPADTEDLPISRIATGSAETEHGFDRMELDLQAGLGDTDLTRVGDNLLVLGGLGKLHDTSAVRALANSKNRQVSSEALLCLLRVHDYSHLDDAIALMSANPAPLGTESSSQADIERAVAEISDQDAVPILLRFVNSPMISVRRCVVKALRKIGSPQSVPALILRLADPDIYIRYDAMYTLASIDGKLNPDWVPPLGDRDQEPKFLAKWKQWWAAEGSAKYSLSPSQAAAH